MSIVRRLIITSSLHEACERSLKRFGIETIDPCDSQTDWTRMIETHLTELILICKPRKTGYTLSWTLGVYSGNAATPHVVHPIAAVQIEYSPFALEIESAKFNFHNNAGELSVSIVAYSPLGWLVSTRAFEDWRWEACIPEIAARSYWEKSGSHGNAPVNRQEERCNSSTIDIHLDYSSKRRLQGRILILILNSSDNTTNRRNKMNVSGRALKVKLGAKGVPEIRQLALKAERGIPSQGKKWKWVYTRFKTTVIVIDRNNMPAIH
jgi:hypothetical protein